MSANLTVDIGVGKDTLSPGLSKVEMGFAKLKASAEGNAKGIRQLDNTFQNAIQSFTGLTGATGQLAGALIEFIPGGLVVGAVLGGVALMIAHFKKLEEAQKNAKTATEDLYLKLLEAQGKNIEANTIRAANAQKKYTTAKEESVKGLVKYNEAVQQYGDNENDIIKQLALKKAKFTYDALKETETQSLQWPRVNVVIDGFGLDASTIPDELKVAVYEAVKTVIDGDSKQDPIDRQVVSESVDVISITYKDTAGQQRQTPALTRALRKLVQSSNTVMRA